MISADLMAQLGITDTANSLTDEAVVMAIKKTAENAAKVPALQSALDTLKTEATTLKQEAADAKAELETFKAEQDNAKVTEMLNQAVTDKKVTNELVETLAADYAGKPDALKKVLDGLKAYTSVTELIDKDNGELPAELQNKTYMELFNESKLELVKEKYPAVFNQLKEAHYNAKK
jgi:hypothetical protein